ncbi:MAG: prepilin peptidase [Clostridiales bacterium]|nr:prepilin peptidase [Clostridiales bacterium]
MTTDGKNTNILIKDMGAVMTPVFYIFGFVAIASAIIVCGFKPVTILVSLFLILLAASGAADINKGIVPDLIPIFITILGIVRFFINGISFNNALDCLEGALCLSVPMLIVALIVKNGFGGGDIKLIAAAGLYLGLDMTLFAGLIAFLIAGIYGVYNLLTKKKGLKGKIRLAPFLALGCAFSELFGADIIYIFQTIIMPVH